MSELEPSLKVHQSEFTRRPNGLLYKMKILLDDWQLTSWEYLEFRKMVRSFCKEYNLYFDENENMVYQYDE